MLPEPSSPEFSRLSGSAQHEIDAVCDRFESAWRAGAGPQLNEFWSADSAGRASGALFRELLRIDLEHRTLRGEQPGAEEYLRLFPECAGLIRAEFDKLRDLSAADTEPGTPQAAGSTDPGSVPDHPQRTTAQATSFAERYRLDEEIARGGMGIVHRAIDLHFQREVAIKRLRPYWLNEPDLILQREQFVDAVAAFQHEAALTARLQHPGIPPVHDLGQFADGLPFLAMKLIQGQTLQHWLAQRTSPFDDLPRWLQVFEHVAQAVGYAHSRGILHRDLKPLNVMVGEFGEVQVMDWGLAKVLQSETDRPTPLSDAPHEQSQPGMVKGTLQYMAPEQARGQSHLLTPRSDVFSLGAILCQILTGEPPYRCATKRENQLAATAADLDDAFARLRGCRADPEIIMLAIRCLAAEPDERPASATAVAQAMTEFRANAEQRVLRAESDRARSEQRRAEQAKRRWLWYGIAAVLLVLVLYYARANAIIADREGKEKAAAALAQASAKTAQEEAANSFAVNRFLNSLFMLTGAEEQARAGFPVDPDLKLRDVLRRAAANIDGKFPEQPIVEARIRFAMGHAFEQLGEFEGAVEQHRLSRDLFRRVLGAEHVETLEAGLALAGAYQATGKSELALSLFEKTVALQQTRLGERHQATLAGMQCLASGYREAGDYATAIRLLEKVLEIKTSLPPEDNLDRTGTVSNLAHAYFQSGQTTRGLRLLEEVVELNRTQLGEHHPRTLLSLLDLADIYRDSGKLEQALQMLIETRAVMIGQLGPDHPHALAAAISLASAHTVAGDIDLSIHLLKQALPKLREKVGSAHPSTLAAMNQLADAYRALGQYQLAIPLFEETLAAQRKLRGPAHPTTLAAFNNLASLYRLSGDFERALPMCEESLQLFEETLGHDHQSTLVSRGILIRAYQDAGQLEKALQLGERNLQLSQQKFGDKHHLTLVTMGMLARSYSFGNQLERAKELFETSWKLLAETEGPRSIDALKSLYGLAEVELQLGEFTAAEGHLEVFWEDAQRLPASLKPPLLREVSIQLIALYQLAGRTEDVNRWQARLQQVAAK